MTCIFLGIQNFQYSLDGIKKTVLTVDYDMKLKSYKNCLHANDNRFIDGVNKNNCEHQGITVFILKSYIHSMLYITQIMTHFY